MLLKYGMPVLAAITLTLSLWSVKRLTPSVVQAEPVAAPPRASFDAQVGAVGIVESSSENIAISVPLPGLVTRVTVAAGDAVKRGQLLFTLDDRDLRAELTLRESKLSVARSRLSRLESSPRPEEIPPAKARVEEAKAQLEDARVQLRAVEAVRDPRAVRQEDLLRRRRNVETAEARLEQSEANLKLLLAGSWKADIDVARAEVREAEAQVARTQADIGRLQVTAPIDGRILQCKVRAGEYAQAGTLPQPLILMGAVEALNIRADIDEKDAWRFRSGALASGSVRGNSKLQFPLEFVRVEPYVIPKRNLTGDSTERVDTRVLQVLYRLPKNANVFPGQQMDLSIESRPEVR